MTEGWRFDPTAVRAAYRDCSRALVDVAERIPDDGWDRPGLGVWTVRDLIGHAGRALSVTGAYLDAADDSSVAGEPTLDHAVDYYRAVFASAYADHAAVAERGRQAGRELGPDPAAGLVALVNGVLDRVEREDDNALLLTPFGTMALIDYLPSRLFELTVHRLDALDATGLDDVDGRPGVALSLVLAAGIAGLRDDAEGTLLALTGRRDLPSGFSIV